MLPQLWDYSAHPDYTTIAMLLMCGVMWLLFMSESAPNGDDDDFPEDHNDPTTS